MDDSYNILPARWG